MNRPVGGVVEDMVKGAGGSVFDSRASEIGHSQRLPTAATLDRTCVALVLSRGG